MGRLGKRSARADLRLRCSMVELRTLSAHLHLPCSLVKFQGFALRSCHLDFDELDKVHDLDLRALEQISSMHRKVCVPECLLRSFGREEDTTIKSQTNPVYASQLLIEDFHFPSSLCC